MNSLTDKQQARLNKVKADIAKAKEMYACYYNYDETYTGKDYSFDEIKKAKYLEYDMKPITFLEFREDLANKDLEMAELGMTKTEYDEYEADKLMKQYNEIVDDSGSEHEVVLELIRDYPPVKKCCKVVNGRLVLKHTFVPNKSVEILNLEKSIADATKRLSELSK